MRSPISAVTASAWASAISPNIPKLELGDALVSGRLTIMSMICSPTSGVAHACAMSCHS